MKESIKINPDLIVCCFLEMTRGILGLELLAGEEGIDDHIITDYRINRPALALTGYLKYFPIHCPQYLGLFGIVLSIEFGTYNSNLMIVFPKWLLSSAFF